MNHGSLFSGIGGFDLAAEWMGWNNVFHCEWMPFPRQVLKHHFPNSISYDDICKTDFSIHRGTIDILTGGFPCQPYSSAGKRLGKADERHLFPEMLRAIQEIQPTFIVGENVRGLTNWNGGVVFEEVCADLENEGYEVIPFILPACAVGAPHRRDRIWFVASNANLSRCQTKGEQSKPISQNTRIECISRKGIVTNSECFRLQIGSETRNIYKKKGKTSTERSKSTVSIKTTRSRFISKNWENFPTQSPICGGDDGLPKELDDITFSKWRSESIKGYGNAIVPQVAYEIFKAIEKANNGIPR